MQQSILIYLDYAVLIAYFGLIAALSIFLIRKSRNRKGDSETADYFLGGKKLGWFAVGASLFASNIGSEHLVGLAGAGASGDFPMAQFEILAALMLLILAWIFVPIYLRLGVFTMPQFLEKRYGSWSRSYLTWVSILGYILTKISLTIIAGGIIFTALLGIDFWLGAGIVVVITGLYTVYGGLKVVVYTDMVQMFILIAGAIALLYFGLDRLGGWDQIALRTDESYTSLWRPLSDPDFPWTGILLGAPILGVWYWCTDQFIVQRVLAARNIDQAQKGSIFAGYLKLLPLFIFVIPGVIAYALSQGENPIIEFPVEDGKPIYDAALPLMTMQLLPVGFRGLVVAGLIAALMSSLSSVFNSCSTLFTIDIYKRYRPQTSDHQLVQVGRMATVLMVILGLAWIPLLKMMEGGLFQKLQSIQSYISPPIAAVFLFGVFSKHIKARAAKYSLISGVVLGSSRLILELMKDRLHGFWLWYAEINFLHFALLLFVICSFILVGFSLMPEAKTTGRGELNSIGEVSLRGSQPGIITSIVLSVILILMIILIWVSFA